MNLETAPVRRDWRSLYRAAIYETNASRLLARVSEAEAAIHVRERELFYGVGGTEEKENLEDALYALRALRSSLKYTRAA